MSEFIGSIIDDTGCTHMVHADGKVDRIPSDGKNDNYPLYWIRLNSDGRLEFMWPDGDWRLFDHRRGEDYCSKITELYTSYLIETGLNL